MGEIIRSNDLVLLTFAQSVLKGEGIASFIADLNTNYAEGRLSALLPRLMVTDEAHAKALRVLTEIGLGAELREHD